MRRGGGESVYLSSKIGRLLKHGDLEALVRITFAWILRSGGELAVFGQKWDIALTVVLSGFKTASVWLYTFSLPWTLVAFKTAYCWHVYSTFKGEKAKSMVPDQ